MVCYSLNVYFFRHQGSNLDEIGQFRLLESADNLQTEDDNEVEGQIGSLKEEEGYVI